jgi:hypothetical protein
LSVEGKLLSAWHVSHSNEKDFRVLFKISMHTTFPSTLFVLLGVGILGRAGKQRQRLRGLEWESHRKPKTFLMPCLKRMCSCTHVLKCKAPVFFAAMDFGEATCLILQESDTILICFTPSPFQHEYLAKHFRLDSLWPPYTWCAWVFFVQTEVDKLLDFKNELSCLSYCS